MRSEDIQKASYQIVLKIYEITVVGKGKVWFGNLVDIFKCSIERSMISKSLDFLEDICMIDSAFNIVDGKVVRTITINDSYMPYVETLYNDSLKA